MAIKIIDEKPDIYLTRAEHDRLQQEYRQFCMFHSAPPSFEEYVRQYGKRTQDTSHE